MTPSMPMPGPGPVKARDLEDTATGVDAPPPPLPLPPPDPVAGALVVVVALGAAVVVDDEPPPATAITGAMGLPVGVDVVMPEGVTELFAYAVQVSANGLPATMSVTLAAESSWIVIAPLVAVNPLTVIAGSGKVRATPAAGIGLGKVTLKLRGPSGVVGGVAPLASIWAVADPIRPAGLTACAADARVWGMFTTV
jgi:hypothetical protein